MRDEAVRNNRIDLNDIQISGIPQTVPETVAAVCRSRLLIAVSELLAKAHLNDIKITVGTASQMQQAEMSPYTQRVKDNDELNVEQRASQYKSQQPLYTFDFLVVPDALREDILAAVSLVWLEEKVFDEWNLREIEPFPRTALNFHGPTGTGKTLAAHAIASYLNMPILVTSYAQIESKYHGEGPKNVEAIFYAAERDGALLFIDEADSLLSKRLSNVSQGSEQAINSMRSQLLISLGQFSGVVIFATNFVESYDRAFRSRVRDVFFPLPDEKTRAEIWRRHFPERLPLSDELSIESLANIEGLTGRDIKHAVIDAALRTARNNQDRVEMKTLLEAIERIKTSREDDGNGNEDKLSSSEEAEVALKVQSALTNKNSERGVEM